MSLHDGALTTSWVRPNGWMVAQGTLAATKDEHPLLASSRQRLPALPPRSQPVMDEELFEVVPSFLPDVLGPGFVTDDPASTRVGAGNSFRATRSYRRADGATVTVTVTVVRSKSEGATATLDAMASSGRPAMEVAGFPALSRPAAGAAPPTVYVVLSTRVQIEIAANLQQKVVEDIVKSLQPGYIAQVEKAGRGAVDALERSQTYEDPQGHKVEMANGRSAFADRVVSTQVGPRQGAHNDPAFSLGPPDYDGQGGYYTLGCRGKLQVAFENNAVVDGPGPDLHVFEVGALVESMGVRISEDGEHWLDAGAIKGQPASLDIASVAQPDAGYRFVEITDLGDECDNDSAGADVDAVGALNGRLLSSDAIARTGTHPKNPQGPSALDDLRRVADAFRQNEASGFPLQVAMRGQGWTLLEPQRSYTVQTERVLRADVNADSVREAVFISTRRESQRVEHELDVYTERRGRVVPLAQAVVASGDASPDVSSLHADGARISFVLAGAPVTYELRNSSLIPLR